MEPTVNEVETSVTDIKTGSVVNAEMLEKATKELEDFAKSLEGKQYAINVGDHDTLDEFVDFIENKAEWKGAESRGIEKLYTKLKDAELTSEHIFLSALEIEGLHYFLSKNSGTGVASAAKHLKLDKIVAAGLAIIKGDNQKLMKLEGSRDAIRHGIQMDTTAETPAEQPANN
jgi:hypothetical protein